LERIMKRTIVATLTSLAVVAGLAVTAPNASAAVPVRGTFTPVDPVRVLDTRDGTGVAGQHRGPLGAGQVTELTIAGVGGVPSVGAGAVVLNVTATDAPGDGFVTSFPCGEARPTASNLNFTRGVDVPNQVTVKVGKDGKVCFFSNAQVELVADLFGWYANDFAARPGYRYHELDPARILDTRDGTGTGTRAVAPLAAGEVLALDVDGAGGVPASGARAVTLNVTTADSSEAGFLTVFPCDRPRPNASNVNFDSSAPAVANLVTVRTGDDGKVCFFASASVNVIADVQGYFADGPGVEFTSTSPIRILDTREGLGVTGHHRGPLGRGDVFVLHVAGENGVPADARAVLLNVTATGSEGAGFITVFPCGRPRPIASNLNVVRGVDRANLVKARVGERGNICIFVQYGTDIIADLDGWFTTQAASDPT
jgi:hypothetical protein